LANNGTYSVLYVRSLLYQAACAKFLFDGDPDFLWILDHYLGMFKKRKVTLCSVFQQL